MGQNATGRIEKPRRGDLRLLSLGVEYNRREVVAGEIPDAAPTGADETHMLSAHGWLAWAAGCRHCRGFG